MPVNCKDGDSEKDLMLMSVFVGEIVENSNAVIYCFAQIDKYFEGRSLDSKKLFFWIKTLLHHTASVSLAFWPTRKISALRGERLRNAFGISEHINALRDRSIRNHIAHMDERIELWWNESTNKVIAMRSVGPRDMFGGNAIEPKDKFEQYVPEEKTLLFRGDHLDMESLYHAVSSINLRGKEISLIRWWDPSFRSLFL